MADLTLDAAFWNDRYVKGETGWDIGYISTPLKEYFEGLDDHSIPILIPGVGNGYEAEYLHNKGFRNVHILDIASTALANFQKRLPSFPESHIHEENFFDHDGKYQLIVEQTFFCALDKNLRDTYANKMFQLLEPGGKLVGLLFDQPMNEDHPPYGGSYDEYHKLFSPYFDIHIMEKAYNSIPPRAGSELFFVLAKPS